MDARMIERVLRVAGLGLRRDGRAILEDAALEVARGELVALMGPSGSGKTTLLRVIAGLDAFDTGALEVGGVGAAPGDPRRRPGGPRAAVGLVFQFHNLFSNLTAIENVRLAPVHARQIALADADRQAQALLTSLGVAHRADAYPHELSGGEAQRVAIARALAVEPALLLMDEPTASLDQARREELAGLLRGLSAEGRTLVIATHDAEFVRALGARAFDLAGGRLTERRPA